MLMGRLGPRIWIPAAELLSVTARTAGRSRRPLRVGIEAPPRTQSNQKLHARAFETLLELDGIVARVEDEERRTPLPLRQSLKQGPHPLCGDLVLVLGRMETPEIQRGNPTVALEAQLGNELVGPSSDDRLACRVTGRMVVETPLGTALGVAAGPDTHVHGVHCGAVFLKGVGGNELSEGFGVHHSLAQCCVETAPAAMVERLEA
jgi:hypothetical protein